MSYPCHPTPIRSAADLIAHLEATGYAPGGGLPSDADLAARLRTGEIRVTCGHDVWPPEWYTDLAWERRSWPLVLDLLRRVPGVNDFRLWYATRAEEYGDFRHVEFTFEGETYDVRWYKVYALSRGSDGASVTFYYHEHDVADFFARGTVRGFKWPWTDSRHKKDPRRLTPR